MKLHERDWAAYVIRTKYGLGRLTTVLEEAFGGKLKFLRKGGVAHASAESAEALGEFEYRTAGRFFMLPDGVSPEKFFSAPDHPRRIELRRGEEYVYPGAAFELIRHPRRGESDILLSCPYVGLAREIWLSKRVFPGPAIKTFIRFDLHRLLSLMQTDDDVASRVRLRIGRVDVLGNSMLQSVRIAGHNVLESYVYKWLFSPAGASTAQQERPVGDGTLDKDQEEGAVGDGTPDKKRVEWSIRLM